MEYKERLLSTGAPYEQPHVYRPEAKFTREIPSNIRLVAQPQKVYRITFDTADCTTTNTTDLLRDEYTWNISLPRQIRKGKLAIERLHVATGTAPAGAGNSFVKVRIPTFQHPNSFDTTSKASTDVAITLGIGAATQSAVAANLDWETIDIFNLSTYFPLRIVLEHVLAGANTVKLPILRMVGKIIIRDESDIE